MVFGGFDDLSGERADVLGALGHKWRLFAVHSLKTVKEPRQQNKATPACKKKKTTVESNKKDDDGRNTIRNTEYLRIMLQIFENDNGIKKKPRSTTKHQHPRKSSPRSWTST